MTDTYAYEKLASCMWILVGRQESQQARVQAALDVDFAHLREENFPTEATRQKFLEIQRQAEASRPYGAMECAELAEQIVSLFAEVAEAHGAAGVQSS